MQVVIETQGSGVVRPEIGGVGVRIRTSSEEITLSGSYSIKLALAKPP